MTAIFVKSVHTATSRDTSGYDDAFGLLPLKKKSFGEGAPHWPIFLPPLIHLWADFCQKSKRICRAMITHPYQVRLGSVPVDVLGPNFRVAHTKHNVISILMN